MSLLFFLPNYPSIRVKVVISVNHFITERQIRYISITLKISNLVIAINLSAKFLNKNAQNEKLAETIDVS